MLVRGGIKVGSECGTARGLALSCQDGGMSGPGVPSLKLKPVLTLALYPRSTQPLGLAVFDHPTPHLLHTPPLQTVLHLRTVDVLSILNSSLELLLDNCRNVPHVPTPQSSLFGENDINICSFTMYFLLS